MTPFQAAVAECRYGVAEPWTPTGARCETLGRLEDLAYRVEALRRGRNLAGWRDARFVWGAEPHERRRKVEVDICFADGKVAQRLSLLVQHETLAEVAAAVLAARTAPASAA